MRAHILRPASCACPPPPRGWAHVPPVRREGGGGGARNVPRGNSGVWGGAEEPHPLVLELGATGGVSPESPPPPFCLLRALTAVAEPRNLKGGPEPHRQPPPPHQPPSHPLSPRNKAACPRRRLSGGRSSSFGVLFGRGCGGEMCCPPPDLLLITVGGDAARGLAADVPHTARGIPVSVRCTCMGTSDRGGGWDGSLRGFPGPIGGTGGAGGGSRGPWGQGLTRGDLGDAGWGGRMGTSGRSRVCGELGDRVPGGTLGGAGPRSLGSGEGAWWGGAQ